MAHLTETHTGGLRRNWFLSLFTLSAVALMLVACEPRQDTEPVVDDPYATDYDDQPITSVTALTTMMDPMEMDGREVWLSNVRIDEVLGDSAFYVVESTTPATGQDMAAPGQPDAAAMDNRVLVHYDRTFFGDAVDGDTDEVIVVGNYVDVEGTVRTRDDHAARTQPTQPQTDAMDPSADPADPAADQVQPAPTHTTSLDGIYIDASTVERHAAMNGDWDQTQPGTQTPATGQPTTDQPATGDAY